MLTVDEARTLITTSVSDADLAGVIAREEAWLARRVGPLEGERVETFIASDGAEVLRLTRPAVEVGVEDDGGAVTDYAVRGWSDIVRTSGTWSGDVLVTYSPTDEAEVKHSLITLVRLTISESAYAAETTQGYSASSDASAQRLIRYSAWRSLLRPRQPTTARLRSVIPHGGNALASVMVEATGS